MFDEVIGRLNVSESTFSEKVNDRFGNSILNELYDPFKNNLRKLHMAWNEAEVKRAEIEGLLMELRTIL